MAKNKLHPMRKFILSNQNRIASRRKNEAIDMLCERLQRLKKRKDVIEFTQLLETRQVWLTGREAIPELEYTGAETIIIRINGGDRVQERKIML